MKVSQLQRLLRSLPKSAYVLLKDHEGITNSHSSDFEIVELNGHWGPRALVVGPAELSRGHHRRAQPKEVLRPIERVRSRQRWLEAKVRRDSRQRYLEDARHRRSEPA